jgi:hypothetical protein
MNPDRASGPSTCPVLALTQAMGTKLLHFILPLFLTVHFSLFFGNVEAEKAGSWQRESKLVNAFRT